MEHTVDNESIARKNLADLNSRLVTHLVDLTPSLSAIDIKRYEEDGLLLVEGLPLEILVEAASACNEFDQLVQDKTHSVGDFHLEAIEGGWQEIGGVQECHPGAIRKITNLLDHGDVFLDIAFHPRILSTVKAILGEDFALHSKGFLMNKSPSVSGKKPWHQDSAYYDKNKDEEVVTVWIPLQDVDEKNGCLLSVRGSHKGGKIDHTGAEAQFPPPEASRIISHPMRLGEFSIMNQHTYHATGVNNTEAPRRAIVIRYVKTNPDQADEVPISMHIRRAVEVTLGGGISKDLQRGSEVGGIEKRHLVINRVLRDEAKTKGIQWIDMGTDYYYPFYESYPPTEAAKVALSTHADSGLHYPSSYGLVSLRVSFANFMKRQFGIELDVHREIMINTGASQAFDALSRTFAGRYVALPDLSLPTVSTVSVGNGAEILRLPSNPETGFVDLNRAEDVLRALPAASIRYLYINSPCNPTGEIANYDYLEDLVSFGISNNTYASFKSNEHSRNSESKRV